MRLLSGVWLCGHKLDRPKSLGASHLSALRSAEDLQQVQFKQLMTLWCYFYCFVNLIVCDPSCVGLCVWSQCLKHDALQLLLHKVCLHSLWCEVKMTGLEAGSRQNLKDTPCSRWTSVYLISCWCCTTWNIKACHSGACVSKQCLRISLVKKLLYIYSLTVYLFLFFIWDSMCKYMNSNLSLKLHHRLPPCVCLHMSSDASCLLFTCFGTTDG